MNLQTRTKTTGRLARALIVGGLAIGAAGTMNGRDFLPGLATVDAQGPALTVIAVPFAGRDGSAHVVYTGGSVVLQAVASIGGDGIPVTLTSGTWDPGDGSGPQVIVFTNSRALELTHTYTGSDSTTFFATIAVSDGTTNATDTFKVQIVPRSLDVEVNMAVDRSLWYNHKRMTIGVITDASGSHPAGWWTDDDNNASTSAAVQAFEVNGHRESGDRLKNPYVDDSTRGLRYLEAHVQRFATLDLQGHAGTPEDPSPDTNGNGYALQTDAGDLVYVGGQIVDAFVASGTPNALVIAGTEAGRTYKDLAQDLLDAYSYGQNETQGGWVYNWNGQDGIDSSSSGWWGVGARAGDVWGLTIPAWVKTRNFTLGIQGTLQAYDGSNTGSDGSCGYRGPNGNTAESGACLIMMAADGVSSTHPRYVATEKWLRRGWGIVNDTVDAHGNIYDMYNVTKAMRLAVDGTGASAPITHMGGDLDWYGADPAPATASSRANGFARYLVANQTGDGRLGQFGSWVTLSTANSWGTLILSTALFEQGPTAICQADAIVCSAGATCGAATVGAFSTANFDGTQSVAGDNAIASYKWDFKDPSSSTPTSTDVTTTHVFDSVGTYPVTLTVKDTKGNASTAICSVVVSIAELPPLASAGPSAGYAMCLGRSDQVVLDASASIARGAALVSYEWDIQAPTNFDAVGATGVTTNQTAYFTSLGAGSWPIKVRVTDDHTSPLVDEAGSTVTVSAADDPVCNRPPVAVADSAATFSGDPVVVSVLTNDSDPDTWQTLTVSGTTSPTSGTLVINVDQTVTYTPNLGFAGTDTFNYTMSDGLDGSATALVTVVVTKRAAILTAGSGTKIYGAADPTLTTTSSGFLAGITVSGTTRDAGENVGSYTTHATATGATLANYNVTYSTGTLSVTKRDATVTAGSGTRIYSLADPTLTTTSSGFLAGIVVSGTSRDGGENVGAYATHATAAGATLANYNVIYTNGSLSITRAPSINGANDLDLGIFRPSEGRWYIDGSPVVDWGAAADYPVPGDYNGDGSPDIAVFRPSNGVWYISGVTTVTWGRAGDIPVPADYDGNGTTDIAVFRPSTGMWYVWNGASISWGAAGDIPLPADYDGDGHVDIAFFRPATGQWQIRAVGSSVWGEAGDVPVPADFNGDGRTDIAVFRPATATWYVKGQFTQPWGLTGDVPMPIDRDGDGVVELGVFRRATGTWYFKNHVTDMSETIVLGMSGDIPFGRTVLPLPRAGDFDGDRKADLTIFRPSTGDWVSLRSLSGQADYTVRAWGTSTDVPVGRDYDGDGKIDPAIYRPSTGRWFVRPSSTNYTESIQQDWGLSTDTPVPADYDGDGKADYAVYRPSSGRWVILLSSTGNLTQAVYDWGLAGDMPVPADYDGDGRADIAVFRPSTSQWFVLNRFTGTYTSHAFGLSDDVPAVADFDGDGKADIAVFRPSLGRWLIKSSIDGVYLTYDWGVSGDIVVPADYDGDGKADIAVYRPSTGMWYVRGLFNRSWGLVGDIPVLKNP